MDLDINNYTIDELFLVLEVNEFDSSNLILAKTDQYIRRFTEEDNILLIDFFEKVKTRLKEYFENGEQEDDENGDDEPNIEIRLELTDAAICMSPESLDIIKSASASR